MAELEDMRMSGRVERGRKRTGSRRRLARRHLSELVLMAGFVAMVGVLVMAVYFSLD